MAPYQRSAEAESENGSNDSGADSGAESRSLSKSRRAFMQSVVGVAAGVAGVGAVTDNVAAGTRIGAKLSTDGSVKVPPGRYRWYGQNLDIDAGESVVGRGKPGSVVLDLRSGTMSGSIAGTLKNITVRGHNSESQSGLRIQPGATIDGFVWPEGGQQERDMAIYTSDGGDDRVTIRNSAWAWMVNNGAYCDKPPMTFENCVAANNNISGFRVGHRDGTSSDQTSYIRNSLIAVTGDIEHDSTQSGANARGIRLRRPANLVVENCWFVYLDVDGTGDHVVFHDDAAGSDVTIRNCAFYNDSDSELVRDKTGGDVDLTIENCTVEGSGSREVDIDFSGSGFTEANAKYPLPSKITGRAVADEIEGIGPGVGPWT